MIEPDNKPERTHSWIAAIVAGLALLAASMTGLFPVGSAIEPIAAGQPAAPSICPIPPPVVRPTAYGIDITDCRVVKEKIRPQQNLSDILTSHGVGVGAVLDLASKAAGVFDVRRLHPGRPYCLVVPTTAEEAAPSHFIYEVSEEEYVVFSLAAPRGAVLGRKPVTTSVRSLTGTVDTSLWQSMADRGGDGALAAALAEIYAWSVDFHYLRAGDAYQVVFEEKHIDGRCIGIGRILAAVIRLGKENHFAFHHEAADRSGYFDQNGRSLEKAFLKAPVRYSHISSRFSRQRLHPVLKTVKPHLGTDYAAPVGTPVMSTGDGTVIAAAVDRYNGKNIKIRHNGTYTTQYLHLSRFATGMKKGAAVRQGDVIGYVGATGMATGPHLCYRFSKNGRPIDPLTAPLPAARHLNPEQLAAFQDTISAYAAQLATPVDALTLANN